MDYRELGHTRLRVSPIGYGAFKIGRNQQIKYAQSYDLPSDQDANFLLNAILDMGINYIDTAPAYGLSEARVGQFLSHRRHEFVLSTKVGETFVNGQSYYDYSSAAVETSLTGSLKRLKTDAVDLVFVHATGDDLRTLLETDVVDSLQQAKARGITRWIGHSAKTVAAARQALEWADVLMVEFHQQDQAMRPIIEAAAARGVGIVIKKALASGALGAESALQFVLAQPGVASTVVGSLNREHLQKNVQVSQSVSSPQR